MKVNPVRMLKLDQLHLNPENPKKRWDSKGFKGLMTSLEIFGFAGVCIVAPDPDGRYTILDANTRFEELRAAKVTEVPCVVMEELTTRAARRKFVLAYDRNKKPFDEEQVKQQLRELAEAGENMRQLRDLVGFGNITELYSTPEEQEAVAEKLDEAADQATASMTIMGPAADIQAIRNLLNHMRQKLTLSRKVAAILGQAVMVMEWEDERLLAVLLATIARHRGEDQE